jgi:shikimate dehydrogenase
MPVERYAVIGSPVSTSLSPVMQAAAFDAAGIAAEYEAHEVPPVMLDAHVACLRYGYGGFNITLPHKHAVMRNLDWIAPDAADIGAVNTVVAREHRLRGFNTDGTGFLASLSMLAFRPEGAHTVVLGAGGAARAVVHALGSRGADVVVAARSPERAREELGPVAAGARFISFHPGVLTAAIEGADLIVNTTPLGMAHLADQSPVPDSCPLNLSAAYVDLVYGRDTPFLARARACGLRTLDGLEMLVQQGADAFRLWTGIEPDVGAMRAACRRELEARACSVS